jgi:hypothetical protein
MGDGLFFMIFLVTKVPTTSVFGDKYESGIRKRENTWNKKKRRGRKGNLQLKL